MTLHKYFWHKFTRNILLFTIIFFALSYTLEMEAHLSRYFSDEFTLLDVSVLTLLQVPGEVYDFLPIIFLLASTATAYRMSVDYELIASRAAGRSGYISTLSLATYAIGCGLLIIALVGPLAAFTGQMHQDISDRITNQLTQLFIESDGQVWLRMEIDEKPTVIRASETLDGHTYRDVTIHLFDSNNKPLLRYEAERAELEKDQLYMVNVKEWDISQRTHAEAESIISDEKILQTNTTRDGILELLQPPEHRSIWTLRQLIADLDRSGFSSQRHHVRFNSELALPILLAVMTILGAMVVQDPRRHLRLIASILIILILGLGTYFLVNIGRVLGEHGTLPIIVSTWMLPLCLLFLMTAIALLMEGR